MFARSPLVPPQKYLFPSLARAAIFAGVGGGGLLGAVSPAHLDLQPPPLRLQGPFYYIAASLRIYFAVLVETCMVEACSGHRPPIWFHCVKQLRLNSNSGDVYTTQTFAPALLGPPFLGRCDERHRMSHHLKASTFHNQIATLRCANACPLRTFMTVYNTWHVFGAPLKIDSFARRLSFERGAWPIVFLTCSKI